MKRSGLVTSSPIKPSILIRSLETQNGALIEAGLDYTIQNFNSTSVKVYARGGAEVWGGDRGTTWRGSGGVTFQF
jgi:hypothetical protein